MKIVSFNIWDLPVWFVQDRDERLVLMNDLLKNLDADIICLQEYCHFPIVGQTAICACTLPDRNCSHLSIVIPASAGGGSASGGKAGIQVHPREYQRGSGFQLSLE